MVTSTPGLRYRFSGVAETYKILVSNATMITDTWDVYVPILQRFSVLILRLFVTPCRGLDPGSMARPLSPRSIWYKIRARMLALHIAHTYI